MNFGTVFKAFDTVVALRDAAKRLTGGADAETSLTPSAPGTGIGGQIETRLTNVVVAALKEAFDRDHARLELERAHLEEERRRSEAALRMEIRRQAADREVGRLRLLAAIAFVGWIASVVLLAVRIGAASTPARAVMAAGWLLLLGGLGAAFSAQAHISTYQPDDGRGHDTGLSGTAAQWLVLAGLAASATSLLF